MNIKKRTFSAVIAVILVLSSFCVTSLASGEDGRIAVSTKEELSAVRNDLDASYYLTADIVFTPEDFSEGGAFYNDGNGWEPIGSDVANAFSGSFDGCGYSISGLVIDKYAYNTHIVYSGLFGVNKGCIKNLEMTEGSVAVESFTLSGHPEIYAGTVVGFNREGTVENCKSSCAVSAITITQLSHAYSFVGGVVGYNCDGAVTGCSNAGEIYGKSTSMNSLVFSPAVVCAGGVVGYNRADLTRCQNVADVTGETDTLASIYTGGICGYTWGDIQDCCNSGNINAGSNTNGKISAAGGIVGFNDWARISNCHNASSTVNAKSAVEAYSGAIAGKSVVAEYSNCYYLDTLAVGVGTGAKGTQSLSAESMKKADSFTGFDFENIWAMGESYPIILGIGETTAVYSASNMKESRVLFDINGDGIFSETDGSILSESFVGLAKIENEKTADANGDGSVDAKDAFVIENIIG